MVPLGQIDLEHCGTWSPGGFLSVGWHDLGHCDVVSGEVDDVDKPKRLVLPQCQVMRGADVYRRGNGRELQPFA